jgi:hypothetical protein
MDPEGLIAPSTRGGVVKTIARLNDEFRSTFKDGRVLMTSAVNSLSVELRAAAIVAGRHWRMIHTESTTGQASSSTESTSFGRSTTSMRPARIGQKIRAIRT